MARKPRVLPIAKVSLAINKAAHVSIGKWPENSRDQGLCWPDSVISICPRDNYSILQSSSGPIWGASRAAPQTLTRRTHLAAVLLAEERGDTERLPRNPYGAPAASSNQIFQLSGSQAISISKLSSSSISSAILTNISGLSLERKNAHTDTHTPTLLPTSP